MKLHEYLTNLMEKNGLNFKEVSDLSAIPYTTVRRVFNGETENPSVETAKSLILAVGGDLNILPRLGLLDDDGQIIHDIEQTAPPAVMECPQITISAELLMSYRSALVHERRHSHFLRLTLLIVSVALFVVMAAVIAMFAYDYAHIDRGWIQSLFFNQSARV